MTKQNKILLGVGAIAIATYLVFKNRKKSFANAGGRSGSFTLPAGSKCPKPYLTVQGITSNAPVTCVPPKTMTVTSPPVFVPTKEMFGTVINTPPQVPQVPSTTPIGVGSTPIPGIPPPKGFM
jgi:hypothetical protein